MPQIFQLKRYVNQKVDSHQQTELPAQSLGYMHFPGHGYPAPPATNRSLETPPFPCQGSEAIDPTFIQTHHAQADLYLGHGSPQQGREAHHFTPQERVNMTGNPSPAHHTVKHVGNNKGGVNTNYGGVQDFDGAVVTFGAQTGYLPTNSRPGRARDEANEDVDSAKDQSHKVDSSTMKGNLSHFEQIGDNIGGSNVTFPGSMQTFRKGTVTFGSQSNFRDPNARDRGVEHEHEHEHEHDTTD